MTVNCRQFRQLNHCEGCFETMTPAMRFVCGRHYVDCLWCQEWLAVENQDRVRFVLVPVDGGVGFLKPGKEGEKPCL